MYLEVCVCVCIGVYMLGGYVHEAKNVRIVSLRACVYAHAPKLHVCVCACVRAYSVVRIHIHAHMCWITCTHV